jgi:predicted PurR-regulated permease PerM
MMPQIGNNVLAGILILALVSVLLYLLSPIMTPFLLAAFFAYLGNPLVNKLQRLRLPRLASVTIVFLILFIFNFLIVLLLIPLIQKQINTLVSLVPNAIVWLQNTILPWIVDHLGLDADTLNMDSIKTMVAENWTKAGGAANWVFKTALHSSTALLEWIAMSILIPVVTFYLLCDWHKVVSGIRNIIPPKARETIEPLAQECDSVLSAFIRGQLLVILALSLIYSIGLSIVGLPLGLMIGAIAGVLSLVPYLGSIVGIIIATVAAYVQLDSITSLFLVWGVFAVGHIIENFVLTPYLIGNRIGLHPVAVIFAVLAGGCLFGFMGVLLALPVAALLMVWIRFLYQRYRDSHLYHYGI